MDDLRRHLIYDVERYALRGEKPMSNDPLFLEDQLISLEENNIGENRFKNNKPVSYITIPRIGYKFLFNSLDFFVKKTDLESNLITQEPIAFGLLEYNGNIKFGNQNITDLSSTASWAKTFIDPHFNFSGKYPLAVYAMVANEIGTIVVDDSEQGFKKEFQKFATLENMNTEASLLNLKPYLIWE